jgi:hypothetical protein
MNCSSSSKSWRVDHKLFFGLFGANQGIHQRQHGYSFIHGVLPPLRHSPDFDDSLSMFRLYMDVKRHSSTKELGRLALARFHDQG